MTTMEEKKEEGSVESPMSRKLKRELPNHIYVVAAQNAKNRFFIPSKSDVFAAISCDYVMIDNGCNSLLLPFDHRAILNFFTEPSHEWKIRSSRGTGGMNSRTLKITRDGGAQPVGTMTLAGNENLMSLPFLRFHLGSDSVRALLENNSNKLNGTDTEKLRGFLAAMGDTEAPPCSPWATLSQMCRVPPDRWFDSDG